MDYTPVNRGFDTFYGYFNQQIDYYNHTVSSNHVKIKKWKKRMLDFIKKKGNAMNPQWGSEGLDFWNQTKDYLEPIKGQEKRHSAVIFFHALNVLYIAKFK